MLKFILFFYFIFQSLLTEEYFLTLRNDKVNLRLGPSFDYPIKIIYKKKYLPVIVKDKSENFRKIQDHEKIPVDTYFPINKKSGIALSDLIVYRDNFVLNL